MKKLFAIALIAATFTACNDDKKTEETKTGSDTATTVIPNADTIKTVTDTTVKTTTTVVPGDKKMATDSATKH
jgi:hypothetical protein